MRKSKLAVTSFIFSLMPLIAPFLLILFVLVFGRPPGSTNFNLGAFIYIPIMGLFLTWWFAALAVVLGIISLVKIRKYSLSGKKLAIAGIVIGAVFVILAVILGILISGSGV